jgi:hypothetical protein
VPIFWGAFLGTKKERLRFISASLSATIVVIASGSSGPLIAWACGVLGWILWRFRAHSRKAIWLGLGTAIVVHFIREKPVWHLIARLSSIVGGTGHHRFRLIDAFIRNVGDWALLGTGSTEHWGWWLGDITSQYVAEGIRGGLVTLLLFVAVLITSFVQLRRARRQIERLRGPRSLFALLSWGTSVSLAAHCVSFVSVSYFGQILPFFACFIATVPALATVRLAHRPMTAVVSLERHGTADASESRVRASHGP